jgi:hypothetical protein
MLPLDGSFEKDRLQVRVQKGGQRPIDFEAACGGLHDAGFSPR